MFFVHRLSSGPFDLSHLDRVARLSSPKKDNFAERVILNSQGNMLGQTAHTCLHTMHGIPCTVKRVQGDGTALVTYSGNQQLGLAQQARPVRRGGHRHTGPLTTSNVTTAEPHESTAPAACKLGLAARCAGFPSGQACPV